MCIDVCVCVCVESDCDRFQPNSSHTDVYNNRNCSVYSIVNSGAVLWTACPMAFKSYLFQIHSFNIAVSLHRCKYHTIAAGINDTISWPSLMIFPLVVGRLSTFINRDYFLFVFILFKNHMSLRQVQWWIDKMSSWIFQTGGGPRT